MLHFSTHHTARERPLSAVESGGRKGRQKAGGGEAGHSSGGLRVGPAEPHHPRQATSSSPTLPSKEEAVKDTGRSEEKAVPVGEVYLMENRIYLKEAESSFLPIRCSRLW